ncbi:hypothetical protein TNCV_3513291 [Trichonephila clavipes]|nr:hypothetical protein TNCV_3513291 [Trichonephila clavipes]
MPHCKIQAYYEQEFKRGRIIGLREAGWESRRIARHMRRNDTAIRRCWQERVDSGRFQRHDSGGYSRSGGQIDLLGPYFSEDKARLHVVRVAVNCLTACKSLPLLARSPDLSAIEHVRYMMGRRLDLPGNFDDLARQ